MGEFQEKDRWYFKSNPGKWFRYVQNELNANVNLVSEEGDLESDVSLGDDPAHVVDVEGYRVEVYTTGDDSSEAVFYAREGKNDDLISSVMTRSIEHHLNPTGS